MRVEQREAINRGMSPKMKKTLRVVLIAAAGLVVAIGLFLVIVFIVNMISTQSEQAKIEPYGQLVSVDGKKMNVAIQGNGEETVVLLPGYGTAAPALDFKLLVDELSPYYKVVAIEPFGYGLSDDTEKERTTENIVREIHDALQQLQIDRYILMGHSIAGLYGIDYVNQYPNEVRAFIGIDSSVPTQPGMDVEFPLKTFEFLKKSGLLRLGINVSGDPYAALPFDEHTKEQMIMLMKQNANNDTMLNEMKHISTNFKEAQHLTFPNNLPVLLFIEDSNTSVAGWEALHEEQVKDAEYGKVIKLEGDHYLHHTQSKAIAESFRAFMQELK
ncbi:alpha/beta fold hydrolase [Paenibacillus sp. 1001270B_150601_E10]|uniref:alpha/beta fold hydrolase n=1 Tax=Paenibacillus sp. 1001270B_150601_E10 TaxID=2787079 RepID=UPI003B637931